MCIPGVFLLFPAEAWFERSQGSGVVSPGDGGTGGRASGPAGREMLSPGKGVESVSGKPRSPFPVLGPVSRWRPPCLTWGGLAGPRKVPCQPLRAGPTLCGLSSWRGAGGSGEGATQDSPHSPQQPSPPPFKPLFSQSWWPKPCPGSESKMCLSSSRKCHFKIICLGQKAYSHVRKASVR